MEEFPNTPRNSGSPASGDADQVFEVRITGSVPDDVLAQLAGIEVTTRELRTSLRTRLRDQAELHGLLARLRTFGLEVVEVRRLTPSVGDPDEEDR